MEYLLYILKQEMDMDIVSTLLSTMSSCSDHITPYLYHLSDYHIIAVIMDYVLMLSYRSQERISKQIGLLLSQVAKKPQKLNASAGVDSDDSDDDLDDSNADADNEDVGAITI
jgi:hypothetical protein